VQRLDWQWSYIFAVILWFPAGVALVKIIAWSQKQEKERQKLQKEQQKIISSLSKIETEISLRDRETQELRQKHQEPLKRRNELEKEISQLVGSDPKNLTVRAEELRKQVKTIPKERILEKLGKIDEDIDGIERVRRENEKRLNTLTQEREVLLSHQHEIEKRIKKQKMRDPKNVLVELDRLQREWQNISKSELEDTEVFGKAGSLLKEQYLLNFQIENKNKEIESCHYKIRNTYRSEAILRLEKLILEQEETIKNLGQDEPRLIEIGNELEKLKAEQLKLTKEKSRISQILAEMQVAKHRLKVPKVIYLTMGVALIVSLLLNAFSYGFIAPP
jgi:hypothetical protein